MHEFNPHEKCMNDNEKKEKKGRNGEEEKEKEEEDDNKEEVEARACIGNETQCSMYIVLYLL